MKLYVLSTPVVSLLSAIEYEAEENIRRAAMLLSYIIQKLS
jgi:hypothetical protein